MQLTQLYIPGAGIVHMLRQPGRPKVRRTFIHEPDIEVAFVNHGAFYFSPGGVISRGRHGHHHSDERCTAPNGEGQ